MDFEILKPEEAATLLKISVYTLKEHARAGTMPCFKVGGRYRFRKSSLIAWIEQQEQQVS